MTTMTTLTTEGWLSDDSIILLGWSAVNDGQVVQVWLPRNVDVPVRQIQEETVEAVKDIPQEIDVKKLTDEDVDEMILETDVDDDPSGAQRSQTL